MWSSRGPLRALLLLGVCLALVPRELVAQSVRFGRLMAPPAISTPSGSPLWAGSQESADVSPARAFISSLVLPGWGQLQQGRRRWMVYAGLEVVAAALYLDRRGDGRDLRGRYRTVAWDVARSGVSSGPRADGDFVYYETLSKWARSGAFDSDAVAPDLQPETDPSTFNGSIWALATQIFDLDPTDPSASPGYANAVDYYRERGYGPEFLWDWSGVPGSQEAYSDLIEESDSRFRAARQAVGILIANHLFSGLDGFVTARLAAAPGSGTELGFRVPFGSP